MSWVHDPWSERPIPAAIAALSVLAMWLVLALVELPALYKFAIGAALAGQLLPLLTPSECRVTAAGVECRQLGVTTRLAWVRVAAVEPLTTGVRVLRKRMPKWSTGLTAQLLPMPQAGRAERRDELARLWRTHAG
jgi:hypothetical protein